MDTHSVRPIEILLVEDNPGDVRLTVEALRDGKVQNLLTVARDGVEALELLQMRSFGLDTFLPDVILLDLNLPRMDGRELLRLISDHDRFSAIPVIVLTTSREEQDVLRSHEMRAAGYMTKPVDFEQLLTLVAEIDAFRLSIVTLDAV